jgi:hypothetical protein
VLVTTPPTPLPFKPVIASRMRIGDGKTDAIALAAGDTEVSLPDAAKAGITVTFIRVEEGKDDLKYYQGQIEVEGDARKIVPEPGFLTGTVEAKGPLDKRYAVLLEPAPEAGSVPSKEMHEALQPGKRTKVPVGDYLLTATLKLLPGLDDVKLGPVPLRVLPAEAVTADPEKLLAGLADKLKTAIRTHDLQVTAQLERVVDGDAAVGAPEILPDAKVALKCTKLATEDAAQVLRDLKAPGEAIALLTRKDDYPEAAAGKDGIATFKGLREGTYEVRLLPVDGKALSQRCEPVPIGVTQAANKVTVKAQVFFASLPFTPAQPDKWTAVLGGNGGGSTKLVNTNQVPLPADGAARPIDVTFGETCVWHGTLADGKAKGDFIPGDFTLAGAVLGMVTRVELTGSRQYWQTGNDPGRPERVGDKAEKELDLNLDSVKLVPRGGGKTVEMVADKDAGRFWAKVPPGEYTITLSTHALNRDGDSQKDAVRICTTPAGTFLVVPMSTAKPLTVVVSCYVGVDRQDPVLTIVEPKAKKMETPTK